MSIGLLADYASIDEVAADLKVHPKTVRRKLNGPNGWPHIMMGGKVQLHVPSLRKIIQAETKSRNPRRGVK